jgi:CelD/BcsL family acetyltransferase involved in cellulose biosynthesis
MTDAMEGLFTELATTAGGTVHHLVCGGVVRASAFGFETHDGYYYYNSAYDPDAAMASPGVVLFSSMIERQIERGVPVFDFLKGDETYKYRHGAAPRPLFAIEGVIA